MCFLGTRSYGIYVFHGIIAYGMGEHLATLDGLVARIGSVSAMVVEAVVGAGVSILVAAASFELFEKPFLRLKSRLAPSMTGGHAVAVFGTRPAE
jgi:peptidoglycan/LPS O-acetylase OafA/YrhL